LCGMSFSTAFAVDLPNKKEIITRAHQSYYNLHDHGLAGFRCDITPNWDSVLADLRKTDPASVDRALTYLNQIHFSMTLGADNKVLITHTQPTAANAEMARAFEQIYSGMPQMISGFYDTASLYILGSPFPEANSEYQLDYQTGEYRLTYKDGQADVVTIMDKNLVISSMNVKTTDFTSEMRPEFVKNPAGLLLAGYFAAYKSKSPSEDTVVKVRIVYQEVGGMQVPQKLNFSGSYGGNPFAMEVAFSGYQITRK
jgi:hypothetical protein